MPPTTRDWTRSAQAALHPDAVSYADVEAQLDAALAATDPAEAIAARGRALGLLAKIACSERFDARRSRAITQALRELGSSPAGPLTPLTTR